jgi:hypothetical protein
MPSENFTPNNVWGSTAPEGSEEELTLPSGQTCRARKVTVTSMIEAGILNNADSLTAMVDQYTRKVKGGKGVVDGTPVVDNKILGDSQALKMMIEMADRSLPAIVISPVVVLHFSERVVGKTTVTKKLNDEERAVIRAATPGVIFTDQIDLEDKMELFEWGVGGLKAFSSFREEPTTDVGDVVPVNRSSKSPKRRTRGK